MRYCPTTVLPVLKKQVKQKKAPMILNNQALFKYYLLTTKKDRTTGKKKILKEKKLTLIVWSLEPEHSLLPPPTTKDVIPCVWPLRVAAS